MSSKYLTVALLLAIVAALAYGGFLVHEQRNSEVYIARVEKWGKPPFANPFTGKVYAVEKYIKSTAKDPDSVKFYGWSKVKYNESRGWLVQCDWGAKNSFGGMNRSAEWFEIKNGQVVGLGSGWAQ